MKITRSLWLLVLATTVAQARTVRVHVQTADSLALHPQLIKLALKFDNGNVVAPTLLTRAELQAGLRDKDLVIPDSVTVVSCSSGWALPRHSQGIFVEKNLLPENGLTTGTCDFKGQIWSVTVGFEVQDWGIRFSPQSLAARNVAVGMLNIQDPGFEHRMGGKIEPDVVIPFSSWSKALKSDWKVKVTWYLKDGQGQVDEVFVLQPGTILEI